MNILVTVGAQMPFDRMIKAVDDWAGGKAGHEVFAQVGDASYQPRHIECVPLLEPGEFRRRVMWADLLVAHAGMGSILTALQYGKPILVMPRLGRLRETRNDHQVATAERFKMMSKVAVAMDEVELVAKLEDAGAIMAGEGISASASDELVTAIRQFIHGNPG